MNRRISVLLVGAVALLWSGAAAAGPVESITNWLRQQIEKLWGFFVQFMHDLLIRLIETQLELINVIVHAIPAPDFLNGISVCGILSSAGPWATWAIGTFRLGEAMALLATALVFRLTRIILTAFQWT